MNRLPHRPAAGPADTATPARIEDVARVAGVSIATVSRVLNGITSKASAQTVARVRQVAAELGYRPAQIGRALRTNRTKLVAMLIPDMTNAFYAAIAKAIEASLSDDDYAMILCNTAENPRLQDAYLAEMQSHSVRGIALLGAVASPGLAQAVQRGLPIVFVNRKAPPGIDQRAFVGIDNYRAGQAVAQRFLDRGYVGGAAGGECAALHGPLQSSASADRLRGLVDVLAAAGVTVPPARRIAVELTIADGYRGATALLAAGPAPRAVFCGNDLIAYGLQRRCQELGLAVPDRLALFGFDDNPLNEWLAPWLSTVHVPYDQFGPAVRRALNHLWAEKTAPPLDILLPHDLKLRQSA